MNPSRLRGGLAVFIKTNLRRDIRVIDKSHTMIWLKLHKNFFNFEQDLYICGIYISPSPSSYMKRNDVDKNIFDKLDSDVTRFSKVMIMGDLNVHISGKEYDFIVNESTDNLDDFVPDNYSIDNTHQE